MTASHDPITVLAATAVLLALLGARPGVADVWTFETPSQNIQCSVGHAPGASDIICTIIRRSGPPAAPRPANCSNKDWGHTFSMHDTGRARIECVEANRERRGSDRAEYGVTGEFGGLTCTSSTRGLRCENRDGHGFFLSRRKQEIF